MPNKDKWNGLGGKINANENPKESVIREVFEESGLDISHSKLHYVGVVTWTVHFEDKPLYEAGMHAYIVYLPNRGKTFKTLDTREGLLEWMNIDKVCDSANTEIVSNIPKFLPEMISSQKPKHYHLTYNHDDIIKYEELVLED
jgi:8-oxo-dGTP diphosphatase